MLTRCGGDVSTTTREEKTFWKVWNTATTLSDGREPPPPSLLFVRSFASSAEAEESAFGAKANAYLETLVEAIEAWADDNLAEDVECDLSDGVLTIKLGGGKGTYVLNKQAPNLQIWWSSPKSGPLRFEENRETKEWVDSKRGNVKLEEKLMQEWAEFFPSSKTFLDLVSFSQSK